MGRKGKNKKRDINPCGGNSETSKKLFAAFLGKDDFGEYCKNNNYVKFDQHPDVKACVKIYADLISSMTIHLMENTDSGDKRVKNALSNLIDIEPYKYTTRKTLMYKCVEELILTGNSILIPTYNQKAGSNYIDQLVPIPQSAVTYNTLDDGGYSITYTKKIYAHDEIIHFVNNPNLNQPWRGESYKVYINDILLSLQQGQNMKSDYYTNHFKPKIVFSVHADANSYDSEDEREEFYNTWLKTKPGQPYILNSELVDFKSFPAMSLSDIALDANTKIDKLAIANIIGVPGFMVGVGTFDRYEHNNFINTRVNPIVKEIQQEMTKKIIISPSLYVKLNIDSLKVFDTETHNEFMLRGKAFGIFSANEVRIDTGKEPIDKPEMNEYSTLENFIPANKIGNQKKLNGGE